MRSHQFWTQDKITALREMYSNPHVTTADLEKRFLHTYNNIKTKAQSLSIHRKRTDTWSECDVLLITRLYVDEHISAKEIELQTGRTWRAITHKARILGLYRPKPNPCRVVRDFFHTIDTETKAYWLGFIAADGTVSLSGRHHDIRIDLQPRDLHWLERFRDLVAPGMKITKHGGRSFSLGIGSQKMVCDVIQYGIGPRKSYTLCWPLIPEPFSIPFLLGYFDGDGTFTKRINRPGYQWSLLGTLPFLNVARTLIQNHAGVPLKEPVRSHKTNSHHLYRISANGPRAVIVDRMLNKSRLGLPRKHLPIEIS